MNDKKLTVIVSYTGQDDYQDDFSPETPVGTVKSKAMHQFGIEPSAADKYVIKFNGVNIPETTKIGTLGGPVIKLVLLLKKPQEKGYVR